MGTHLQSLKSNLQRPSLSLSQKWPKSKNNQWSKSKPKTGHKTKSTMNLKSSRSQKSLASGASPMFSVVISLLLITSTSKANMLNTFHTTLTDTTKSDSKRPNAKSLNV